MNSELQPAVGARAPDFELIDTENRAVQLSSCWSGHSVVIVFLRHLGCTFCRTHVLDLRAHYEELRRENTRVICIAMGTPKLGKAFKLLFELPFPMLMTGEHADIYRVYNLQKASLGQLFGISLWGKGFAAMRQLSTKFHGGLQGDGFQMSGTFVVDSEGIIRLAYRGKDSADNPSSGLILETLRTLHSGETDDASKLTIA